uniref:Uncharacterized protein n=1 Tax=Siphoviridae sp. ctJyX12 TaxID=2827840 RepID=A0A8S5SR49_9CAUD|nr:MAG TPA: hypothetical protein [Siphoviridae sp. ctJyX12]
MEPSAAYDGLLNQYVPRFADNLNSIIDSRWT